MKTPHLVLIAAVALFAAGCVQSLNPLYTEGDVIFDERLLGRWVSTDRADDTSYTLTQAEEKRYRVVHKSNGGSGTFVGHLVMVDGNTFFDACPELPDTDDSDENQQYALTLPLHHFYHIVEIGKDSLTARIPNHDWVWKHLKEHPEELAYTEIEGEDRVITAKPKEIQRFLIRHLDTPGAYGESGKLVRDGKPSAK